MAEGNARALRAHTSRFIPNLYLLSLRLRFGPPPSWLAEIAVAVVEIAVHSLARFVAASRWNWASN